MSLTAFQHALSRLVMSPPFRLEVVERPAEALAGFDLTQRERERLEALAHDSGLRTGTMIHRSFRLSMLTNTLPRTCKALGPEGIKETVHAYWLEQPSRSLLYVQEGLRFGHWALPRLRRQGGDNPFLPEVLEAEIAMLELARQELWETPPPEPPALEETVEAAEALEGFIPRLHPYLRVIRFRRDPDLVLSELAADRLPEDLPEGEHYLLVRSTAPGKVEAGEAAPEAGRVLLACAGEEPPGSFDEEGAEMVRELVEEGYLVLVRRHGPEGHR